MRTKVLLVITRLTVGGDTNVVLDTARHFNAHHPTIEAHLAAGPVPSSEIDLTGEALALGIPTTIVPTLVNRPNPLRNIRAVLALRALIRRGGYGIVHTHSSMAGVVGRLAAASAHVPVILHHVHGWGLQEGMPLPMRAAYLAAERLCARFTTRLIAVSRPTAQKGVALGIAAPDKFSVIYNGIDVDRFSEPANEREVRASLGLDPAGFVVGMIGRLDRQKNPLDFIRVAELVSRTHRDTQFVFVGEGALRPACEDLVEKRGLRGRVFFPGFRQDVPRILSTLSVLVSTSLWEGLPVVFQEAMSAGRPIVANDVDGVSDVVVEGETGHLVRPHDLSGMASRVAALLDDRCRREEMGQRARRVAQRFSRASMLEQFEHLYTEACGSHGTRAHEALRLGV